MIVLQIVREGPKKKKKKNDPPWRWYNRLVEFEDHWEVQRVKKEPSAPPDAGVVEGYERYSTGGNAVAAWVINLHRLGRVDSMPGHLMAFLSLAKAGNWNRRPSEKLPDSPLVKGLSHLKAEGVLSIARLSVVREKSEDLAKKKRDELADFERATKVYVHEDPGLNDLF